MTMRKKICDGDCFNCKYDDCINDKTAESTARASERKAVYYAAHEDYRERQKEWHRNNYARLKAAGICVRCRKKPAEYGVHCYECWLRQMRKAKNRYTHGREIWTEEGRCYFCGKPAIPGKKTCEKHYKICCNSISHAWYSEKSIAYRNRKSAKRAQRKPPQSWCYVEEMKEAEK